MLTLRYYDIFLDFDFENLTYTGKEVISLISDEYLHLDAVGLDILYVKDLKSSSLIPFEVKDKEVIVKIDKFDGEIEIGFRGNVPERLTGIYRAPYGDSYIITTQFESVHAREFIPCVDNPAYKAEFKLAVKVRKDLDVISNMPIEKVVEEGDKKIVHFMKTLKMSTYLLYLGIGKFEEIKEKLENKDIIVTTLPGKSIKAKLPLIYAKEATSYYEKYFEIPYALPKMHLITVPEFAFGAMENWGAITFREAALLADEKSALRQRINVATVIAHEIAHQWFGDLVTMKWWDDLWLNESFATFMSYKAVSANHSDWKVWYNFIQGETGGALLRDALTYTHPIHVEVKSPEEIEQIFDEISYGKGASILRMIEAYLGEENFRQGIKSYLKKYAYSNATANDLWSSLQEASNTNVTEIMENWIATEGYPMIYAKVDGNKLILSQERFSLVPSNTKSALYKIPLTLEVNGKRYTYLMKNKEETLSFDSPIESLKINLSKTGFYRVYYETLQPLFNARLDPFEKWGLVNDYYNFLLAAKIPSSEFIEIAKNFFNDDDILVVSEIANDLYTLYLINNKKYEQILENFILSQVKRFMNKKDELSRSMYGNLVTYLSLINDTYALGLAELFPYYDNIDPELKQASAISFVRSHEDSGYDLMLKNFRASKFDEDRLILLRAMVSSRKDYLVLNTLSLGLVGEVKRQDVIRTILWASQNIFARKSVWEWLKTYFEKVRRIYAGTGILGRNLMYIIPMLGIENPDIREFFREVSVPEADTGIKLGLELLGIYERLAKE